MRSLPVVLSLLLVAFAGCAEDAPTEATDEEEKFEDLQVDADEGAIRGIVVDPSITPVVGASVVIKSEDLEAESNADGAFVFTGLQPGTYFLEVSRIGYSSAQTSVNVEAGVDKPPIVKVQLLPDASSLPFTQSFQFDGFIQCSAVSVVIGIALCAVPGILGVDIGDNFLVIHDTQGFPDFIQGEMVWESTQPLGDALNFQIWDGTTSSPRNNTGTSPRIISGDRAFWELGEGSRKEGSPMVEPGEQFAWRVFAGGMDGTDHCDVIPACVGGVGVTLQQEFTIFTNVFYRFQPDDGWLFVEDGAHPVPQ